MKKNEVYRKLDETLRLLSQSEVRIGDVSARYIDEDKREEATELANECIPNKGELEAMRIGIAAGIGITMELLDGSIRATDAVSLLRTLYGTSLDLLVSQRMKDKGADFGVAMVNDD